MKKKVLMPKPTESVRVLLGRGEGEEMQCVQVKSLTLKLVVTVRRTAHAAVLRGSQPDSFWLGPRGVDLTRGQVLGGRKD